MIPKALFKDVDDKKQFLISSELTLSTRRQGEYEKLLCRECETIFGKWDDIGINFIRSIKSLPIYEISKDSQIVYYKTCRGYLYQPLHLFFLSILWRMDVSSRPAFSNVVLGPYRNIIKSMLKGVLSSKYSTYPIMLRYLDNETVAQSILLPQRFKMQRLNGYNFSILGLEIHIIVDQRYIKLPKEFYINESQFTYVLHDSGIKAFEGLQQIILGTEAKLQEKKTGKLN